MEPASIGLLKWLAVGYLVLLLVTLQMPETLGQIWPRYTVQQTPKPKIIIDPPKAVNGSPVTIECKYNAPILNGTYLEIKLRKNNETVVMIFAMHCPSSDHVEFTIQMTGYAEKKEYADCLSAKVIIPSASRTHACGYVCLISLDAKTITEFYTEMQYLKIGDPSPRVSLFEIRNPADNGSLIPNRGKVRAGTNVSLACETKEPADPVPEFTVFVDGRALQSVRPPPNSSRVTYYQIVPKRPSVTYKCSAYNTFGERQNSTEMTITATYGDHRTIEIPNKVALQSESEILICSLAINPMRPLQLTVEGGEDLLQDGYPRYDQKDGYSRAYIKLKDSASPATELNVTCGLEGEQAPVDRTVQLSGTKPVTPSGGGGKGGGGSSGNGNTPKKNGSPVATPSVLVAMVTAFICLVYAVFVRG